MKTWQKIKERLRSSGRSFLANDNIASAIEPGEMESLQAEVQEAAEAMLRAMVIDVDNDHNTKGTATRIAKMYLREVFAGRYQPMPKLTEFPNYRDLDQIYTLGPIDVRSTCSHHLAPIVGQAWIGVIPGDHVIGISKFSRLARWVMERPQIQEEAAMMLADEIEGAINPKGLAVIIRAKHLCMTWRGVKEAQSSMTTSVLRGAFRDNSDARAEFYAIIAGQGYQ